MPEFNNWFPTSLHGLGHVNVKAFGAIGNGNANLLSTLYPGDLAAAQVDYPNATSLSDSADWCGIQAAIDYALENDIMHVVIPEGIYKTTDTIHLGYGMIGGTHNFQCCQLSGAGWAALSGYPTGTTIIPQFVDRPVINIQGGRESGVRKLAIYGNTLVPDNHAEALNFRADPDNYVPVGAVDDEYAPFCGVCIDAYYAGTAYNTDAVEFPPANPYPTPRFPAWVQAGTKAYNKAPSSQAFVEDCQIHSTLIGIMNQPYGNGNGDFTKCTRTSITCQKIAVAVGNSQARNMDFTNMTIDSCHTGFDVSSYGNKIGNISGTFNNLSVAGMYRLLYGTTGGGNVVTFVGLYGESNMGLGTFNSGTVTIDGCLWSGVDAKISTGIDEWLQEPFYTGTGRFRNCMFMDRFFYHFMGKSEFYNTQFVGPTNAGADDMLSAGQRKAMTAFGRVFVNQTTFDRCGGPPFSGPQNGFFSRAAAGTATQGVVFDGYNNYYGSSLWGIGQKDTAYSFEYDVKPMARFGVISGTPGTISGITRTLAVDAAVAGKAEIGDVIQFLDQAWYAVEGISGSDLTIKQITNFHMTGGTYTSDDPDAGTIYYYPIGVLDLWPAGQFSPGGTAGIFMKTTAASPTISFVDGSDVAANRPAEIVATSKPLWIGEATAYYANAMPFPTNTVISVLNPSATTLTMSANALTTGTWAYGPGIKRLK